MQKKLWGNLDWSSYLTLSSADICGSGAGDRDEASGLLGGKLGGLHQSKPYGYG